MINTSNLHKAKASIKLNDFIAQSRPVISKSGTTYSFMCPFTHHEHDNTNPGFKATESSAKCFKCSNETIDIVGWIQFNDNCSKIQAIRKTLEIAGFPPDDEGTAPNHNPSSFQPLKSSIDHNAIYAAALDYNPLLIADLLHIKRNCIPENIGVIQADHTSLPYYLRKTDNNNLYLVAPIYKDYTLLELCGVSLRAIHLDSSNRPVKTEIAPNEPKYRIIGATGVWRPVINGKHSEIKKVEVLEGISKISLHCNTGVLDVEVIFGAGNMKDGDSALDLDTAGIEATAKHCDGYVVFGDERVIEESSEMYRIFLGSRSPLAILPAIFLYEKDLMIIDVLFKSIIIAAKEDIDCYCMLAALVDRGEITVTTWLQAKASYYAAISHDNRAGTIKFLQKAHDDLKQMKDTYLHFTEYKQEYIYKIHSGLRARDHTKHTGDAVLFKQQLQRDFSEALPIVSDQRIERVTVALPGVGEVQTGTLMIIGGETGTGKTSISTRYVADVTAQGLKAAFFSLEEDKYIVIDRLELYKHSNTDLLYVTPKLHNLHMIHIYAIFLAKQGYKFIVIDHANFLCDDVKFLQDSMMKLNEVVKNFDTIILLIVQAVKEIDFKKTPELDLLHMYGGSAIKTYAYIALIVQKFKAIPNVEGKKPTAVPHKHVSIVKHRFNPDLEGTSFGFNIIKHKHITFDVDI